MRFLVTGGAGFIGSHLSERLLREGNEVVIIDNFNSYYNPEIKRNNIKEVEKTANANNNNCTVVEGDIRNAEDLEKAFHNGIDVVVHLAAMAGVRPSIENERLYWDVNIMGTQNIFEKCREHNVKKVVFASSSSVYGNNPTVPFKVTDKVDNPISPYAATKKAGELMCHTQYHLYDVNVACLRFFTVFGPRQRPDLAINKFTRMILNDEAIPVYGDGTTSRDYTYIDDIVQGIMGAINWVNTSEKKFGVFNLGGDEPVTLTRMIETIEKVLGKTAKIDRLPMQPGDVNRTCADISLSTKELSYKPETTFEEGIQKFVEWYKLQN